MVKNHTPDNEPHESWRSGQTEQSESAATAPEAIERRLKKNILFSVAIFIFLAAIFGTRRFAIGVSLGGALAYLNYRWLHSSLKGILDTAAADGETPPGAIRSTSRFVLRWLVILAVLAVAAWLGGRELAIGVTVGLFAFAGAAMIEAITQVYLILRGKSDL